MKRRGGIVIGDTGEGAGGFALVTRRRGGGRGVVVAGILPAGPSELGYETFETSPYLGDPIEGFEFAMAGTFYRYTSSDAAATFVGQSFAPEAIVRTAMEFSQEDTAGNVMVSVPNTNAVAQLWVAYLPVAEVTLTIYRKHRGDPEVIVAFVGKVMSITFEGPEATMVCAPVRAMLQRKVPSMVFQSQCNHNLYGVGCGVLKASFKQSGTVLATSGNNVSATVFGANPDGWFNNGWMELASGSRRFIVAHVGASVELMNRFLPALAPGTAFDAYPGCDRTETICRTKFNNLPRHLGFPRIPTRNPYDGSIV